MDDQYQFRGLGRQCLSIQARQEVAVGPDAHVPYSSGQADLEGNRAGQCRQILDP